MSICSFRGINTADPNRSSRPRFRWSFDPEFTLTGPFASNMIQYCIQYVEAGQGEVLAIALSSSEQQARGSHGGSAEKDLIVARNPLVQALFGHFDGVLGFGPILSD